MTTGSSPTATLFTSDGCPVMRSMTGAVRPSAGTNEANSVTVVADSSPQIVARPTQGWQVFRGARGGPPSAACLAVRASVRRGPARPSRSSSASSESRSRGRADATDGARAAAELLFSLSRRQALNALSQLGVQAHEFVAVASKAAHAPVLPAVAELRNGAAWGGLRGAIAMFVGMAAGRGTFG
jgi:hypothetical protein